MKSIDSNLIDIEYSDKYIKNIVWYYYKVDLGIYHYLIITLSESMSTSHLFYKILYLESFNFYLKSKLWNFEEMSRDESLIILSPRDSLAHIVIGPKIFIRPGVNR